MDLALSSSLVGSVHVLRVGGEIDMDTAPVLREELVRLLHQGRARIVIDMSGVTFLDSSGIHVLIGSLRRARSLHGWLRVAGVDDHLHRVFEVANLLTVLPTYASVDDAIGEAR